MHLDDLDNPSSVKAVIHKPQSEMRDSEIPELQFCDESSTPASGKPKAALIKPACLHFQPSSGEGEAAGVQ